MIYSQDIQIKVEMEHLARRSYRLLQETTTGIDCDPSLESCGGAAAERIERPNGHDLFHLLWTVTFLELIGPYLTLFPAIFLFRDTRLD